jgi:hypothetical protein
MDKKYNQGVADSNRRRTKHGNATRDTGITKLYQAWIGIKSRCLNPNHEHYHRYGGRGITICKTWSDDFATFQNDVGSPPSSKHTIDRIDNDKGYEVGNVRWATRKEQSNNISSNVWVEFDGMRKTWAQWAEHFNVPYDLIMSRVRRKLPIEKILQPRLNKVRSDSGKIRGVYKNGNNTRNKA